MTKIIRTTSLFLLAFNLFCIGMDPDTTYPQLQLETRKQQKHKVFGTLRRELTFFQSPEVWPFCQDWASFGPIGPAKRSTLDRNGLSIGQPGPVLMTDTAKG